MTKDADTLSRDVQDPAASMSLLNNLLANPLDAGYTTYRASHGARPSSWLGRIIVFFIALALGLASVATVQQLRRPVGDVKGDLRTAATQRQENMQTLQDDIQSLSTHISSLSVDPTNTESDPALTGQDASTAVSGPGILVTLTDRSAPGNGDGLVRDQDLTMVINALWSAGAEAITINGQRIGPRTFVRTAGSVILVNTTPVSSPYEVRAIGDANELSVSLVRGVSGDYLSAAQSVTGMSVRTQIEKNIEMPGLPACSTRYVSPYTEGSQ